MGDVSFLCRLEVGEEWEGMARFVSLTLLRVSDETIVFLGRGLCDGSATFGSSTSFRLSVGS